jgi:hypothetical protein
LGILKQRSLVALNDSYHMLAVIDAEVKEGGFEVQGIPNYRIKESSIIDKHTLQQPFRCNDFAFPRPEHLDI